MMSNFRFNRYNNFPPIVKNLIIINVVVWVAQLVLDKREGMTDWLTSKLALYPIGAGFQPYQIATHMFAHAAYTPGGGVIIYHILLNMYALWMFGRILENVWGPKRFLLFYLISGVGAAVVHLLVTYLAGQYDSAVGASGAIMGLFAAFGYLFPNTEMYILFIPVPIKAKWVVLGFVAYDLISGFTGGDDVAHFAHLGGALTGLILVMIWNRTNRKRFY